MGAAHQFQNLGSPGRSLGGVANGAALHEQDRLQAVPCRSFPKEDGILVQKGSDQAYIQNGEGLLNSMKIGQMCFLLCSNSDPDSQYAVTDRGVLGDIIINLPGIGLPEMGGEDDLPFRCESFSEKIAANEFS